MFKKKNKRETLLNSDMFLFVGRKRSFLCTAPAVTFCSSCLLWQFQALSEQQSIWSKATTNYSLDDMYNRQVLTRPLPMPFTRWAQTHASAEKQNAKPMTGASPTPLQGPDPIFRATSW